MKTIQLSIFGQKIKKKFTKHFHIFWGVML